MKNEHKVANDQNEMDDRPVQKELVLSLSLAEEHNQKLQLFYTSQLYGTFFCIFGSFVIKEDPNDGKKKIFGVRLQLINYKGLINIGIVDVLEPQIEHYLPNITALKIGIVVRAFEKSEIEEEHLFYQPYTYDDLDQIIFERKLLKMSVDERTGVGVANVFDEEFYDRDGLYVRERDRMDVATSEEDWKYDECVNRFVQYDPGDCEGIIDKTTGGRCPRSKLIIVTK